MARKANGKAKPPLTKRARQRRLSGRDLPIERVLVVHSTDTDDAPNRDLQEAYADENIERLQENAGTAPEGEELRKKERDRADYRPDA